MQDTIPNFEELIESIPNTLLCFAGGSGETVMRCQSLVFALNEILVTIFDLIFFLQHNDNIVLFVVSIGFLCVQRKGLTRLSAYKRDSILWKLVRGLLIS